VQDHVHAIERGRFLSAVFLVAGTCIGGGMLALPVATGVSGFIPSTLMMTLCWLAMTASALLLLEVNLWMKEGAHLITMASTILGPIGKIVSWVVYLFICYASLVAYTAAGGGLVIHGLENLMGLHLSKEWGCLLFIAFFAGLIDFGHRIVGRINTILFTAMVMAYFALIGTGISEVKLPYLTHTHWPTSFLAVPLLLTTFSFQTMLPSLTPYLRRNASVLRWAIIGGTSTTFIIYLVWQWMVLGIIPVSGPHSLIEALEAGEPVTQFLRKHVKSASVSVFAEYFAFFGLVTSFIGIALGLFDFLSDGLKIRNEGKGKGILSVLIMIPTFIFATYFERIFLLALDTSGGFGDSILNGIMPVLMVWTGRYILKFPDENRTPGGKCLLIVVLAFFLFALTLETFIHTGYTCSMFEACQLFLKEQGISSQAF